MKFWQISLIAVFALLLVVVLMPLAPFVLIYGLYDRRLTYKELKEGLKKPETGKTITSFFKTGVNKWNPGVNGNE